MVEVDGTWLYIKYKGILLSTFAQNDNNKIFPITFVLVKSEKTKA